jgi:membrane-associated phospholipid phosphatase
MPRVFTSIPSLREPPRLSPRDFWLVLAPLAAWAGIFHLREEVIRPRCSDAPQLCHPDSILLPADRAAVLLQSSRADTLSFTTQYLAGIFALLVPMIWVLARRHRTEAGEGSVVRDLATDFVLFLHVSIWNGLFTEAIRLLVQRPRPFVYADPARLGADASHYTSFISGHTSFSAAAATWMVLAVLGRGAGARTLAPLMLAGAMLVFLTGLFRVLAGRHFFTDVLAAAVVGAAVALGVRLAHPPRPVL